MITHHATLGASNIRHEKLEHNNSEIFTRDIMNQVYEGFLTTAFIIGASMDVRWT